MLQDLGDVLNAKIHLGAVTHASVASNGANATYGGAGTNKLRVPCDCRITGASWEPVGADSDASNTASYRLLTLIDGGASGTGTTVIGSLNLTASLGSNTVRALTLVSGVELDENDVIYFSQATVGGAHSAGTVLVAGQVLIAYKPI